MDLVPINGCVLVELTGDMDFIETPDKQYETHTSGVVIRVYRWPVDYRVGHVSGMDPYPGKEHKPDWEILKGKKIYFEAFKETLVKQDDKDYAFVKVEDIRGYDKVKSTN